MSGVSLTICLRDPGRSYGPREPVHGVVRVKVTAPMECRELELLWVLEITSKHGSDTRPGRRRVSLFRGNWEPGEYEYEFEMAAPRWPPSYEGPLLQWKWKLSAVAGLESGDEARALVPVTMQPPPGDGLTVEHKNPGVPARVTGSKRSARAGLIVAVLMVGLGVLTARSGDGALIGMIISIGVIAAIFALNRWLKWRYFGDPQLLVELASEPALSCTVHVKPSIELQGVDCTLVVYERAVLASLERKHEYRNTIFERTISLQQQGSGIYAGSIALPALGAVPLTCQVGAFSIGWSIDAEVHHRSGGSYRVPSGVLWAQPARGAAALRQPKTSN